MSEQEISEMKTRLGQLEGEVTSLKEWLNKGSAKQGSNPSIGNRPDAAGFDPATAEASLRQALVTLKTIASLRNQRFIFMAAADPHNVTTSGPQPVQPLLTEEIRPLLAKVGSALSSLTRLKMLYLLTLQEECTTALLAEASGVSGGNLFQQLNELYSANLIFQPSRGRYRLSELGRMALETLALGVSNIGKTSSQSNWFENSAE